MNGSKRKRVSWFIDPQSEKIREEEQQNLAPEIQEQVVEPEKNLRRISFVPTINVSPHSPTNDGGLSVIQEETPSNKKIIRIAMPSQQKQLIQMGFQTPKSNISEKMNYPLIQSETPKQKSIKQVFDINKELKLLGQEIDSQINQQKEICNKEREEMKNIGKILTDKKVKLQNRLLELDKIEEELIQKENNRPIRIIQRQLGEVAQINEEEGSSQQIRKEVIKILGFQLIGLQFENQNYSIQLEYEQCRMKLIVNNKGQGDKKYNLIDLMGKFRRDLSENKLVLQNIQIHCANNRLQYDKNTLVVNSIKQKFIGSQLMPNQIIQAMIHYIPDLMEQINQLEIQLEQIQQIYGCQWKLDQDNKCFHILYGYQFRINNLMESYQNFNKIVLRFQINFKDYTLILVETYIRNEIFKPFLELENSNTQQQTDLDVTFGDKNNGEIPQSIRQIIDTQLKQSQSLIEMVECLNCSQLSNQLY